MRRGWFVAAGGFLALFAATTYLSIQLPLLDTLGPGPGFFPLILALLGGALTVALIVQLARQSNDAGADPDADGAEPFIPDRGAMFRIVGIIVLLLVAFSALDPLGYRLTALFFITLVLLVLGVRNIPVIAVVALVFSFGVFHSFYYWLKVPLPVGGFGL